MLAATGEEALITNVIIDLFLDFEKSLDEVISIKVKIDSIDKIINTVLTKSPGDKESAPGITRDVLGESKDIEDHIILDDILSQPEPGGEFGTGIDMHPIDSTIGFGFEIPATIRVIRSPLFNKDIHNC
jgi:hypothetical protein